ncbi:VOC family protein [Streptomyces sp. NPDC000618]|uniref:VOC family protein n=1 Tax=Streptomyces sp. NPDC000618 TaxID=3154265 RepID=UPI00332617E7
MLKPEDQFHVGIVAEDLRATTDRLSQSFGLEWHDEMGGPVEVELPTGTAVLDFRCAYSKSTPRIEVVRPLPGTLWEPTPGSGIHHIGYWSDDVAADTADLECNGYVVEATRRGPDGTPFFAFLRAGEVTGFRVELVSSTVRPTLERLWSAR